MVVASGKPILNAVDESHDQLQSVIHLAYKSRDRGAAAIIRFENLECTLQV